MRETPFYIESIIPMLEDFAEDPELFRVHAYARVMTEESSGGEFFKVDIVSPARLALDLSGDSQTLLSGRGTLVMQAYDEETVLRHLQGWMDSILAKDWDDLWPKVSRYFDWAD